MGSMGSMGTLPKHAWTGTAWRTALSIDQHDRSVQARFPGAGREHVACGVVWRDGAGRIVGELRTRRGKYPWPPYEGWVEAPPVPVQPESTAKTSINEKGMKP